MRERTRSILAYTGAALLLVVAILVPFKLIGGFTGLIAHAGLRVDSVYTGGEVARAIQHSGYQVAIHQPVRPHWLQRSEPFVQVDFSPVEALPAIVDQQLDLDNDGRPDVRVHFSVPADPQAPLHGSVAALNARFLPLANVSDDSFSRLLIRTGDRIVLRVPLNTASGTYGGGRAVGSP